MEKLNVYVPTEEELGHEQHIRWLVYEFAERGKLVPLLFTLAERANPLEAYEALKLIGNEEIGKQVVRQNARMLEAYAEEGDWTLTATDDDEDITDDDVANVIPFVDPLTDDGGRLDWATDEVLDQAQANADKIVARWHEAADSVGADR